MRRVRVFLGWKANWWRSQAALRESDSALAEGLKSYTFYQAEIQDSLATTFCTLWKDSLDESPSENEDDDDDDDDDFQGDDDDDSDNS